MKKPTKEALPKASLPSIRKTRTNEQLPCTRTQRGRLLALNIGEKLQDLIEQCSDIADYIRAFERMIQYVGPSFAEWQELYGQLLQAHRDADLLQNGLVNDPTIPLALYHQVVGIKKRWIHYRERELCTSGSMHEECGIYDVDQQQWQQDRQRFGVVEEERLFDELIAELKHLVAISPR